MYEYYESIKDALALTLEARKREDKYGSLTGAFTFVTVFCVIPLLPYIVVRVVRARGYSAAIRSYDLHLQSLVFWWIGLTLLCVIVAWVWTKATGSNEDEQLSIPQMRFALSLALASEIANYQTNRIPRHIKKALELETQLLATLPANLVRDTPRRLPYPEPVIHEMSNPLDALRRFHWFKLEPSTSAIVTAFREFHAKIRDRIKVKKELSLVALALQGLAAYLYTEIPEVHRGGDSDDHLEAEGSRGLEEFAAQINSMSAYVAEATRPTTEEKIKEGVSEKVGRISSIFAHPNVFLCFMVWLIFLASLVGASVRIAKMFVTDLKLDSTLVALMVATPIAGAATLTAVSRGRTQRKEGAERADGSLNSAEQQADEPSDCK